MLATAISVVTNPAVRHLFPGIPLLTHTQLPLCLYPWHMVEKAE